MQTEATIELLAVKFFFQWQEEGSPTPSMIEFVLPPSKMHSTKALCVWDCMRNGTLTRKIRNFRDLLFGATKKSDGGTFNADSSDAHFGNQEYAAAIASLKEQDDYASFHCQNHTN